MLQDDYLMRRIRIALAALTRILGLKKSGSYQEALDAIDQALEVLFGLSPAVINAMDDDSLLALLSTGAGLDEDRTLILANLFKERADIFSLTGQPGESLSYYRRALILYLQLYLNPSQVPEDVLTSAIMEILAYFPASTLPEDAQYPLFFYFERTKQFAKAAAMLDGLIAANGPAPDLVSQARDFYTRLLAMNNVELKQGNMTREIIQDRLDQLP